MTASEFQNFNKYKCFYNDILLSMITEQYFQQMYNDFIPKCSKEETTSLQFSFKMKNNINRQIWRAAS